MGLDVDAFIDRFVYDIRGKLESALDAAAEENSPESVAQAEKILSFLFGRSAPFTDDERCRHAMEIARDTSLPPSQRKVAMRRALESSNKRAGRPKEKGPDAIRAFTIYLKADQSWREIALELQGSCESRQCIYFCPECGDVKRQTKRGRLHGTRRTPRCPKCRSIIRAKKEQVCKWCADAVRDLVGQLEDFLKQIGSYPTVPRVRDIKSVSPDRLRSLLSE
jgi:ssDNA-binding Zn-finger/Zn-ribbon topoisomerase 1